MKNLLFIILSFCSTFIIYGQEESVKPTFGVELFREVKLADIEKKFYVNVTVELKASELVDWTTGVKVTVKDIKGKRIYKKRFKKSYLYAFSDGTIQIGKGNATTQLVLFKSKENNEWFVGIREKGIY